MTNRVITLIVLLLTSFYGFAQMPETVRVETNINNGTATLSTSSACAPGQSPFAGTTTQMLGLGATSNDINFLCFGDTLFIDHAGNANFGGDPDTLSDPGIVYGIYECSPQVTGPDLNTLKQTDNCLFDMPNPGINTIWRLPFENMMPNGDAFVINDGNLQGFFNSGDPREFFFAPITVDEFDPPTWEIDGVGGAAGPCIHANINDAFSAVFLNEIQASNINSNAGGNGCTGSLTITGGTPQVNNSNYSIQTYLDSDPTVFAHSVNNTTTTHGETYVFDVPQNGLYNIEVFDGNGCGAVFQVMMNNCTPVSFSFGDSIAMPGESICIPLVVENYNNITSFQMTISWDPSILTYTGVNAIDIPMSEIFVGPAVIVDSIRVAVFDFFQTPRTIADGGAPFEICFDVIGVLGDNSFVRIEDNDGVEITGTGIPDNRVAYRFDNGSVLISDGSLMIISTSCGTQAGVNMGEINLEMIGGVAPYTYTWEQVGMPVNMGNGNIPAEMIIETIAPLAPGDYAFTVTDDLGVTVTATIPVALLTGDYGVQLAFQNPTCSTDMDGEVTANIFNGVAPYEVSWSNSVNNSNVVGSDAITGLASGNYAVTVTDANGCEATASTALITSAVIVDTIALQHVTCIGGGADGAITVETTGGVAPYNYIWNDPAASTMPSLSNLPVGNYCVTATDNNNCPSVACFDILAPAEPTIDNINIDVDVLCPNDMTGVLTAQVTPGNAAIDTYQWSNGMNGQTISNLGPGEYKVTVTAVDGCVDSSMIILTTPAPIGVSQVLISPTCPGGTNGEIRLTLSGATMPYSILWDDGSTFGVRSNLVCDSAYQVTITGANGCDTLRESIILDCPPAINITFTDIMQTGCFSSPACDGEALVIASGGTSTTGLYNYTWSNGEESMGTVDHRATQLCQGWNFVEINDNNCSVMDSVFIDSPDALALSPADVMIDNASCQGEPDGSVTVAAVGGTPGYMYNWQGGTMGPTITGLSAGLTMVTVTDANSCTISQTIVVGEPAEFVLNIDSTQLQQVLCPDDSSGIAVVFPTGGNAGLIDYQWTGNVSTSSVGVNLKSGNYTITATDSRGCMDDITVTLAEPAPITFTIGDITAPQCFGFQTVMTIDTAFGGNGPLYEFSVNNGPKRPILAAIPVLGGRTNLVTVFDRDGCRAEEEVLVNQPAELVVDLGDDVEIQLGESYTIDPFIGSILPIDSIVWQPLNDLVCDDSLFCLEVEVSPLETQAYQLTVFDTSGCSATDMIIIDIDKNRNVFVPNVFSPNGDDNNDIFKPFIGPGVANINYMRIFDRWGEILYADQNFLPDALDLRGWNGTFNGKLMNPGVYVYLIEVQFVDGQTLLYRGDVTLLY